MITQLAETTGSYEMGWLGVLFGIFMFLLALVALVLVIAAIISTLIHPDTTAGGKLLWVLFILWFPIFGAVAWFVVGRNRHLNRFLGIDKNRSRHSGNGNGHSNGNGSVGQHSDAPSPQPSGPGMGTA